MTEQSLKCEHGVNSITCFNCRFKEKFGMKIEMFNGHHYVRLKDVEANRRKELEGLLREVGEDEPLMRPDMKIPFQIADYHIVYGRNQERSRLRSLIEDILKK